MLKIKVSDATEKQLDGLVAKLEGLERFSVGRSGLVYYLDELGRPADYSPSTQWAEGGPIIERERIDVFSTSNGTTWCAQSDIRVYSSYGPTPLIAAMRCFVASRLGVEVEIPEELA